MAVPPEAFQAAIQVRDETNYEAGEGPLQPVFEHAFGLLREFLGLYDRAEPGDTSLQPARLPTDMERPILAQMWGQASDELIDLQQRSIQMREVNAEVDRRTVMTIDILRPMRHVLAILRQPYNQQGDEAQAQARYVREAWIRMRHQLGMTSLVRCNGTIPIESCMNC